jgi:uncharacterized protein YbaR (Trm112 family)
VQDEAYARLTTREALVDALCAAAAPGKPTGPHAAGILLLKRLSGDALAPPRQADERALAAWLVARSAAIEQERLDAMARYVFVAGTIVRRTPDLPRPQLAVETLALAGPERARPVSATLRRYLCCPDCHGPLDGIPAGLRCAPCGSSFPATYGVPSLLPRVVPEGPTAAAQVLERVWRYDRKLWNRGA